MQTDFDQQLRIAVLLMSDMVFDMSDMNVAKMAAMTELTEPTVYRLLRGEFKTVHFRTVQKLSWAAEVAVTIRGTGVTMSNARRRRAA